MARMMKKLILLGCIGRREKSEVEDHQTHVTYDTPIEPEEKLVVMGRKTWSDNKSEISI